MIFTPWFDVASQLLVVRQSTSVPMNLLVSPQSRAAIDSCMGLMTTAGSWSRSGEQLRRLRQIGYSCFEVFFVELLLKKIGHRIACWGSPT